MREDTVKLWLFTMVSKEENRIGFLSCVWHGPEAFCIVHWHPRAFLKTHGKCQLGGQGFLFKKFPLALESTIAYSTHGKVNEKWWNMENDQPTFYGACTGILVARKVTKSKVFGSFSATSLSFKILFKNTVWRNSGQSLHSTEYSTTLQGSSVALVGIWWHL